MTNSEIKTKFDAARRTAAEFLASRDDEFHTGISAAAAVSDLLDELENITLATLQSLISVFETQSSLIESIRMLTAMIKEVAKSHAGDKRQIAELETKLITLMDERFN